MKNTSTKTEMEFSFSSDKGAWSFVRRIDKLQHAAAGYPSLGLGRGATVRADAETAYSAECVRNVAAEEGGLERSFVSSDYNRLWCSNKGMWGK